MKFTASLYIVPTPIGNLSDITLRALEVLKAVEVILAEDTRTSRTLLQHYHIEKPLESFHAFNEHKKINFLIERLRQGVRMALISDAGTPGISDPGYLIIRAALQENIPIDCLPGPTAFVPALIKSGLPTDRFVFEGFLPHKKGRLSRIKELANEKRTLIFYESPHRLIKTLEQLAEHFGQERMASVSRELTKHFEETHNGTLHELLAHFRKTGAKGELVLVVAGKD
ncbi:MAG: 16S rRNA (cytidine(1402)-2'-O)-methyltransferase [Cyclobacteriaceae bacterium]|nr:16S rRNA (cytidine(1402)-2'-O)-methyltransferase [Cyclobacteriaceae bacterium]MDW8330309.1 16S rRNA (cytidine(1402)-2'-O)-methyltransferase [Cyclobacteriaceae bacterium]